MKTSRWPFSREVFLAELAARGDRGGVLHEVHGLAHLEAVVFHTLRSREQAIEHAGHDRDARRNVGAGQEARLAAVQIDAVFGVHRGKPVEVLVIADAVLDRQLLDVRRCVGDAGTEVTRVTAGECDFAGELRHRRAGQHDRRLVDRRDQLSRTRHTVVDDRVAVEHRAPQTLGLLNAFLRQVPLLVARVAVGRRRHDVGVPVAVKRHHQLALHLERTEAAARLRETAPLGDCAAHHGPELLVLGERPLQRDGLVEVDGIAGRPAREVLAPHLRRTRRPGSALRTAAGASRQAMKARSTEGFLSMASRLASASSSAACGSTVPSKPQA